MRLILNDNDVHLFLIFHNRREVAVKNTILHNIIGMEGTHETGDVDGRRDANVSIENVSTHSILYQPYWGKKKIAKFNVLICYVCEGCSM